MATKCGFARLANALTICLCLLPGLLICPVVSADDDDDDIRLPALNPVVRLSDGEDGPLLLVDPDRRDWLGLEVVTLQLSSHQPVYEAVAVVAPVTKLQRQRDQVVAAMLAVEAARTGLQLAVDMHERLRSLSRGGDGGVVIGKIRQAEIERNNKSYELKDAEASLQSLYNDLLRTFGPGVAASMVVSPLPAWLQSLLVGEASLLRVTLNPDKWLANADTVRLDMPDGRNADAMVLFPDTEQSQLAGQGWLAIADISLPVGMRLGAHVLQSVEPLSGVALPETAVVWFGGVPWVYIEAQPNSFTRVQLDMRLVMVTDTGWFMQTGFTAGTVVVTRGAQLLLSEEKHGLIPDEDDRP